MLYYTSKYLTYPDKSSLLEDFKGKKIEELPTPSLVINRDKFQHNSNSMLKNASKLNASFRAHVKTHKTLEGTLLQLGEGNLKTSKLIVSTLAEAWNLLPLVERGEVDDIVFSLPVVKSRIEELADLASKIPNLRVFVDHDDQIFNLIKYRQENPHIKPWSVFVKIDMGTHRAGLINESISLDKILIDLLRYDDNKQHIQLHGFYCHAGHSYSADSLGDAKKVLIDEIDAANKAAQSALAFDPDLKLVLSVGATPTAHASHELTLEELNDHFKPALLGSLELHAGNYPCCDLQQLATHCVNEEDISISVIAEIVSKYPNRGETAPGEQLINAGVIAMSRESGPIPGYGKIIEPKGHGDWYIGKLSQEHGILVPGSNNCTFIPIGTQVRIIPQHACITAASHPWYYVVDDSGVVVDIWVPFRGW
ncbi:putative serine dehydratase domain-containing protein [Scheffersomyces amazonensis]|uniref:putative serine dehydratase domain-containing protein n=1 Tax=Scheffersomyces amazonensis TaxID=1078765 RepID=UPI00315CECB1